MAHIRVPDGVPGMRSLLACRPEVAAPIASLADVLLHAPNTLPAGDRELIGAYVSALNGCAFCCRSHTALAACHLQADESVVASIVHDPDGAAIPPKLKALLDIARKVQEGGRSVSDADIARARACGATDREIHDTVLVAAMFCLFNRYVDGLDAWTPDDPAAYRERARIVARQGYAGSAPAGASGTP